ncbi:MAG: RnfABCDGE type electron transport complex subunit D [Spirochaetes bacterium]|nr:RnfABCDGE type electron transport complex subunit D [Spirochaetota bacterium]
MFQKQAMMRRVLIAIAPIFLMSLWMYGLRALFVVVVSFAVGILVEWLFERKRSGKVSEAVLVTSALFALSLPPAAPLWIVAIGSAFGVFMAKAVFGGFGRNVFNPAIAGRLFVYISFATILNRSYVPFGTFGTAAGSLFGRLDAYSGATPLGILRSGGQTSIPDLLLGLRTGAIGESPVLLILAAGIYLVASKTASWRIILSELAAGSLLALALRLAGIPGALPVESLLSGSFLFVAVFMGTDPVSAPKKKAAQFVYGTLIGICAIVIRTFSVFPEGTSFAVFIGNTFASLIDELVGPKRAAAKPAGEAAK